MSTANASANPKLPQRVGRYDVVGRLDVGGMAEILLGQLRGARGFEHPVVIKRILPHLSSDPSFVQMFLDEASIAAGIRHPNVVHVHELGQEGEDLFLVMEYLEGEPAHGVQLRAAARGMRLDPGICAWIVAQAAAGLHAAHELTSPDGRVRNVVHRDVSPQNVFITYSGQVKVLDFGIAKAADRNTKTDTGLVKGKFNYMSPEQCRGEPVDRRTDVFALGVVLYELLTGRRLFKRSTQAATIRAVLEHEVIPPSELVPDIPPELESACMKALSRSRKRRYQSAAELRRDLLRVAIAGHDEMPEQRLASLMRELFGDRIAVKSEMLRKVEHGEVLTALPPTVADAEVQLPLVDTDARAVTDTSHVHARAAPRRRLLVPLVAIAAIALVGAAALFALDDPDPSLAPAAPGAAATPSREVSIQIRTTPPGATVAWNGERVGTTPLRLERARTVSPARVRLELEGHEPLEERIVADVDQRLSFSLRAVPPPEPPAEPAAEITEAPEPAPEPRTRRRRPRRRTQPTPTMTSPDFGRWE